MRIQAYARLAYPGLASSPGFPLVLRQREILRKAWGRGYPGTCVIIGLLHCHIYDLYTCSLRFNVMRLQNWDYIPLTLMGWDLGLSVHYKALFIQLCFQVVVQRPLAVMQPPHSSSTGPIYGSRPGLLHDWVCEATGCTWQMWHTLGSSLMVLLQL